MKLPGAVRIWFCSRFVIALIACFLGAGCTIQARQRQAAVTGTTNRDLLSKFIFDHEGNYNKIQDNVRAATVKALDTCKESFKNGRWNCDLDVNKLLVVNGKRVVAFFGHILPANKEGAYLQAIGSASVMYTLTRNCRLGRYENCACVHVDRPLNPGTNWRWFGCNENLQFGENVAKYFIDDLEQKTADRKRAAINLHNNEVGRKVVRISAIKSCKCHGPTASCTIRTCSRHLLAFTEVAEILKERYEQAMRVKFVNNTIKRHDTGTLLTRGRTGSLAYYDRSPNYCRPDKRTGFPGMRGRKCIHDNDGAQKCNRMCTSCGLKFRNDVVLEREKCVCKFVWCCHVKCETCERQLNTTVCS